MALRDSQTRDGNAASLHGSGSAAGPPQPRRAPVGRLTLTQVQQPARTRAGAGRKRIIVMANILVNIEKGIEIGAEDALKWLTGADKALHAAPAVIAALAILVAAMEKPLA